MCDLVVIDTRRSIGWKEKRPSLTYPSTCPYGCVFLLNCPDGCLLEYIWSRSKVRLEVIVLMRQQYNLYFIRTKMYLLFLLFLFVLGQQSAQSN